MDLPSTLSLLPLWYVVFLLSLTCHEAAHAFGAKRGGDPTAFLGGQMTLNPLPHVLREPLGTVVIPLVTYLQIGWMMGWASAPYDPRWERQHPRRAAWMAAAGPLANLALASLGFVALKAGLATGAWIMPGAADLGYDRLVVAAGGATGLDALGRLCSILLVMNLVLGVFNLIPLPPMDGAAILSGFSRSARTATDLLRGSALGSLVGLLLAWWIFPPVFKPVLGAVLRALYG